MITCDRPKPVTNMTTFIGSYKAISRIIPEASSFVGPLEEASASNAPCTQLIRWTEELNVAFERAKSHLKNAQSIHLPHANENLWIVTDVATVCWGLGATMYAIDKEGTKHITRFYSAKLDINQRR